MDMPITDAINAQFDSWDQQIEDLKNQTKEAAKEQAEKIKKDIQEYAEKKKEELNKEQEATDNKSSAAEGVANATIDNVDQAVSTINKILAFLKDTAELVLATAADLAMATPTLASRSAQSLGKLTQI